jgi:2-dehydro-3-deoxyphosphogluconate aldolase/(4S)-4-hydroxy-2-oxoglutarate aldolase
MQKSEVIEQIRISGIVPVIRIESEKLAQELIDAILKGGIRIFEVTMTVPNALELITSLVGRLGRDAIIGAGTVLDADTARRCIDAGSQFIVSPVLKMDVIDACHSEDRAIFPGAMTPSEIFSAWQAGADAVKVFPAAAVGGPSYIKSIKGPLPDVELMPTGGVTLATIGEYLRAGAIAAGVGGELTNVRALKIGQTDELTRIAKEFVKEIQKARS